MIGMDSQVLSADYSFKSFEAFYYTKQFLLTHCIVHLCITQLPCIETKRLSILYQRCSQLDVACICVQVEGLREVWKC